MYIQVSKVLCNITQGIFLRRITHFLKIVSVHKPTIQTAFMIRPWLQSAFVTQTYKKSLMMTHTEQCEHELVQIVLQLLMRWSWQCHV